MSQLIHDEWNWSMQTWYIRRPEEGALNDPIIAEVAEIEYHGEYMGESYVSVTINSEVPLDLRINDYIVYRGERFFLSVVPACKQQATKGSCGDAFVYENVKFNSLANELATCDFLDVVLSDNNIHWSALPTFSFYCENVKALADRIQANLDRVYGENKWVVEVGNYDAFDEEITIDKQTVWDALALVDTTFHTNFIIRGRHIYIGTEGTSVDHVFKCGVGNGLVSLERTIDDSQKVITRLRAYGNETNVPTSYYRYSGTEVRAILKKSHFIKDKYRILDRAYPQSQIGLIDSPYNTGDIYLFVFNKSFGDSWQSHSFSYKNILNETPIVHTSRYYIQKPSGDPFTNSKYFYKAYEEGSNEFDLRLPATKDGENDMDVRIISFLAPYTNDETEETNVVYWAILEPEDYHDSKYHTPILDRLNELFENSEQIEVKVSGYSGLNTEQILLKYPASCDPLVLPNNLAIKRLMLPGFPVKDNFEKDLGYIDEAYSGYKLIGKDSDVFLESPNKSSFGAVEGSVYIDGTDNEYTRKDIYPSIEGITKTFATNAGFNVDISNERNENLDEIAESNTTTDPNVKLDNGDPQTNENLNGELYVFTKDLGFNIQNYLMNGETPQIYMRSGMCVGRQFDIHNCVFTKSKKYKDSIYRLTIARKKDENLGLYFPNSDFPIKDGDKFSLLNIRMPEIYFESASQRLLIEALKYFVHNDKTRFSYTPSIDNLWIAREHRKKKAEGKESESIYSTIYAGDLMMVESDDLDIGTSVRISSLTIKENSQSPIPEFDIQLQDKKSVGSIQRMQNKLEDYTNSSGGSLSYDQVKTVISDNGKYKFISKRDDDFAEGQITLEKGVVTQSSHNGSETAADGLIEYYKEE